MIIVTENGMEKFRFPDGTKLVRHILKFYGKYSYYWATVAPSFYSPEADFVVARDFDFQDQRPIAVKIYQEGEI